MDDGRVVAAQLGRRLRADADVAVRCPLGLPVVTRVAPVLDDGTPFPTRYWLCCPLAARRVGRVESGGGVQALQRHAAATPGFAARLAAAHRRYAAERDAAVPPGAALAPDGGVGGSAPGAGIKCLHAHYADHAAGNENPVGEAVAPFVEPLDCTVPCVAEVEGEAVRNPAWREPK
ncbi:MAG: DUF501 domain-containing protein [Actinobacteria bacterium]|nr:DUF501 domain-containing protein [Actinomycetota bacterium]